MEFDQYASVESRAYGVEITSKSEDEVTEEAPATDFLAGCHQTSRGTLAWMPVASQYR